MSESTSPQVPGNIEAGDERTAMIDYILSSGSTWAEPGSEVSDGIFSNLANSPPQISVSGHRWRRPLIAIATLAITLVAVLVFWPGSDPVPSSDVVVAVVGTDLAPAAAGTVAFGPRGSGWWIRLDVTHLPPAPEGTYYEGWVGNEAKQVSIGTFHMRKGEEPVVLWAGVSLDEYPRLQVTLQEEVAGAEPSTDVMLTGRLDWSPGNDG